MAEQDRVFEKYVKTDGSQFAGRKPVQTWEQFQQKYGRWIDKNGNFQGQRINGQNTLGKDEYVAANGIDDDLNGQNARDYYNTHIGFQSGAQGAQNGELETQTQQDYFNDEVDVSAKPGNGNGNWATVRDFAINAGKAALLAYGVNAGLTSLAGTGTAATTGAIDYGTGEAFVSGAGGPSFSAGTMPAALGEAGGYAFTSTEGAGELIKLGSETLTAADVAAKTGWTLKDVLAAAKTVAGVASLVTAVTASRPNTYAPPPSGTNGTTTTGESTLKAPTALTYAAAPTYTPNAAAPTMVNTALNNPYAATSTASSTPAVANPSVATFVNSLDWSATGTPGSVVKLKAAMQEYGVSPEVVAASAGYPLGDVQKLLGITPNQNSQAAAGDPASNIMAMVSGAANMSNPYGGGSGSAAGASEKSMQDWLNDESPRLKEKAAEVAKRGDALYGTATEAARDLRKRSIALANDQDTKKFKEYAASLGTQDAVDQRVGQSLADVTQKSTAALAAKRRDEERRGLGGRSMSNADALQVAGMQSAAAQGARSAQKSDWGQALAGATKMQTDQGMLANEYEKSALGYGNQAAAAGSAGFEAAGAYSKIAGDRLSGIQQGANGLINANANQTSAAASMMNAGTNAQKAIMDDRYNWANLTVTKDRDANTFNADMYKTGVTANGQKLSFDADIYKTGAGITSSQNSFNGGIYDSNIRKEIGDNNYKLGVFQQNSTNTTAGNAANDKWWTDVAKGLGWAADNTKKIGDAYDWVTNLWKP